jgi:hypothetical protein
MRSAAFALILAAAAASAAHAQRQLRELATDRPDRTESPITVDKGHGQLELDFFSIVDDRTLGFRQRTVDLGAINAKIGLRRNMDLQLVGRLLTTSIDDDGDLLTGRSRSVPDVTARLKVNVWGNDGGRTAFALMPFVTVPTSDVSRHTIEGGLIAPLGIALGRGWDMGLMAEADAVPAETGSGHQLNLLQTATVSHAIAGSLGGYVEAASETMFGAVTRAAVTGNGGLTLGVGDHLQFDAGLNVGLNKHAERVRAFVGMARRF